MRLAQEIAWVVSNPTKHNPINQTFLLSLSSLSLSLCLCLYLEGWGAWVQGAIPTPHLPPFSLKTNPIISHTLTPPLCVSPLLCLFYANFSVCGALSNPIYLIMTQFYSIDLPSSSIYTSSPSLPLHSYSLVLLTFSPSFSSSLFFCPLLTSFFPYHQFHLHLHTTIIIQV